MSTGQKRCQGNREAARDRTELMLDCFPPKTLNSNTMNPVGMLDGLQYLLVSRGALFCRVCSVFWCQVLFQWSTVLQGLQCLLVSWSINCCPVSARRGPLALLHWRLSGIFEHWTDSIILPIDCISRKPGQEWHTLCDQIQSTGIQQGIGYGKWLLHPKDAVPLPLVQMSQISCSCLS